MIVNVFAVRSYLLGSRVNSCRIDEEFIFSSYLQARSFMLSLCRSSTTVSEYDLFRLEIIKFALDDKEGFFEKEIYSISGELLTVNIYNASGQSYSHTRTPKGVQCALGDFVELYKAIEHGESNYPFSVKGIALALDEDSVTIGCINPLGYFEHRHIDRELVKAIVTTADMKTYGAFLLDAFKAWCDVAAENTMREFLNGELSVFEAFMPGKRTSNIDLDI
jgi:hypothetical protein